MDTCHQYATDCFCTGSVAATDVCGRLLVIGGIGSVSGSIIASFLFIASSEWLLRFLDNETWIGGFRVPLLRSGFRMVVFSIIIMAVVLFFRKGIMGDRELFQKKPASTAKAAKKEARSK